METHLQYTPRKMEQRIISVPARISNIPKESAGMILFEKINTFDKNAIALHEVRSKSICTYGDLATNSVNLALNLRKFTGIVKNDHMAIISENTNKFWVATLAGLYLAAPMHLLNPGYTAYELKKFLMMSRPKLIFCSRTALSKIQSIRKECAFINTIILFDDESDTSDVILYSDLITNEQNLKFEFEKIDDLEHQVAVIFNSSGTTGFPKAAMIGHNNLRLNLSHAIDSELYPPLSSHSVAIHIVPFYHVHGFMVTFAGLYRGVKFIIMNQFEPKMYLQSIQKYQVTTIFSVPTLNDFLANSPLVDAYDISSVEEMYSAAGGLKQETHKKLMKKFKLRSVRQVYGLTEVASAIFITPIDPTEPKSCGRVVPGNSVKIVDPETCELRGPDQSGEICVRASSMIGYVADPESTRDAFDSAGFVRTGDIGYYDENRNFYIIDRMKDLIKYKSFQVPPLEIEEILLKHPKVEDVAVIGKPDDRYGELAVAFVVTKEGADVGEGEVKGFLEKFVCVEKRLHGGVRFVGEIPRNAIGKILRKDLRKLLQVQGDQY